MSAFAPEDYITYDGDVLVPLELRLALWAMGWWISNGGFLLRETEYDNIEKAAYNSAEDKRT